MFFHSIPEKHGSWRLNFTALGWVRRLWGDALEEGLAPKNIKLAWMIDRNQTRRDFNEQMTLPRHHAMSAEEFFLLIPMRCL